MKMKLDEEHLGPDRDRAMDFETDDEENQAERDCYSDDDDSESGSTPSRRPSNDCIVGSAAPSWPQSYRMSMDIYSSVTSPSISFLKGGIGGASFNASQGNSFLSQSTLYKRPSTSEFDSTANLSKPLIPEASLGILEEVPPSTLPAKSYVASPSWFTGTPSEVQPSQQCSFAQATVNAINVLCGIGLLTTPYAIKEGGWSSLLLLFSFGIVACYTGILLKRCLESSPGLQTFPDIGQAAFGKAGRLGIAIILYVDLYATCVEYVIMMGDNLAALFPNIQNIFAGTMLNSNQISAIIATLIVLPTVWLRNLSLLSYLSAGGVITSVLLSLCLLWLGVIDDVGFHPSGTFLNFANVPVTIGVAGFCYAGHSVLPNIYSSMSNPSQFPLVLITSFVICWFLYTAVAICGFLMFGDATYSQFTLNMPKQFAASKIAVWTSVFNPISKFALTLTPVALSIEELLPPSRLNSHSASILIRTILVAICLIMALTIPFFAFVMALIGSFLAMLVALVFPCACYLSILKGKLSKLQVTVCVVIIIMAVIFSFVGTYSAISKIVDKF